MLGVKTLLFLSKKFDKENFSNIRFWLSFQTPKLAEKFDINNGLNKNDTGYLISDRLSFYSIREKEDIIDLEKENEYFAILIIDI